MKVASPGHHGQALAPATSAKALGDGAKPKPATAPDWRKKLPAAAAANGGCDCADKFSSCLFRHTAAHAGDVGNEIADRLAKRGTEHAPDDAATEVCARRKKSKWAFG